jgi:hypothetical protein
MAKRLKKTTEAVAIVKTELPKPEPRAKEAKVTYKNAQHGELVEVENQGNGKERYVVASTLKALKKGAFYMSTVSPNVFLCGCKSWDENPTLDGQIVFIYTDKKPRKKREKKSE